MDRCTAQRGPQMETEKGILTRDSAGHVHMTQLAHLAGSAGERRQQQDLQHLRADMPAKISRRGRTTGLRCQ